MKKFTLLILLFISIIYSNLFAKDIKHFHGERLHTHSLPKSGIAHTHRNNALGSFDSKTNTQSKSNHLKNTHNDLRILEIKKGFEGKRRFFLKKDDKKYLREMSEKGNIQAQILLAADLDEARHQHRRNMIHGRAWAGIHYDLEKPSRALLQELFSLYKKLHASLGSRYAYKLAEMAVFDGFTLTKPTDIRTLLESSYGQTNGMSEALMAMLLERRAADKQDHQLISSLFEKSASQGNPYSSARVIRKYLPGGTDKKSDKEALPLLLDAEKRVSEYATIKYNDPKRGKIAWDKPWLTDTSLWNIQAEKELRTLLGPVAFRQATRLIQSNDKKKNKRALDLYRLASSYDIQKAHMALAFLHKHRKLGLTPETSDGLDIVSSYFLKANRAVDAPSLGVYNITDQLLKSSADEYRKRKKQLYGDNSSAGEVLAVIGIGLLLLGHASSGPDFRPDYDKWSPGNNQMESTWAHVGAAMFLD